MSKENNRLHKNYVQINKINSDLPAHTERSRPTSRIPTSRRSTPRSFRRSAVTPTGATAVTATFLLLRPAISLIFLPQHTIKRF